MTFAAYVPPCIAPCATPGRRAVRLPRLDRGVADDEDLGWPGIVRSGLDDDPAGAVGRGARWPRRRSGRSSRSGRPRPTATVRAEFLLGARRVRRRGRSLVDVDHLRPRPDLDPSRSSWRCADAERSGGYGGRTGPSPRRATIRASAGRIDRKSRRSVSRAISPRAPDQLDPGRAAADDHERHPGTAEAGSASRSAASKAMRIRRRISVASSSVLRPGATAAHSGWSK